MKTYFKDLAAELKIPDPNSAVYFVARSYLVFIALGSVFIALDVTRFVLDQFYSAANTNSCAVCFLEKSVGVIFFIACFVFLGVRLYFSLWKGRMARPEVWTQLTIILPVLFLAFSELFIFPARLTLIFSESQTSATLANVVVLAGTLFACLISFKLLRIVNTHLKFDFNFKK